MTATATAPAPAPPHRAATEPRLETLLVAGILLAALTEAVAGTILSLGRGGIMGDTHATPDEFAWLDIGYTTLKLLGFLAAPWLMSRLPPRGLVVGSTVESGDDDMMAAILLRGLGLGLLFLSITLIAFGTLDRRTLAAGIGLFSTGRQLGGLMGVAALQTLIDHDGPADESNRLDNPMNVNRL
ncbi:hypothetical protein J2847_005918 [Azospirillum agricola]|uniref:hypothetical protein n=1 Tax=Azospirillum agricola TaxID=1720247 RepID=UPI001AE14A8A|nr:hypothetical protein [Azospirillum agricola]MBP2232587.1 hypothetical protein [Azospirillum agricola]